MTDYRSILRNTIACVAVLFLAGCLAPPKRHAWQISRDDLSQLQGADTWPQLSTDEYVRVPDSKREEAVALLRERTFIKLDASQLAVLAPGVPVPSVAEVQPYLVRGVLFVSPPLYTIVRFDAAAARLLVQQFTYNRHP